MESFIRIIFILSVTNIILLVMKIFGLCLAFILLVIARFVVDLTIILLVMVIFVVSTVTIILLVMTTFEARLIHHPFGDDNPGKSC
jgi:hypothetical protein